MDTYIKNNEARKKKPVRSFRSSTLYGWSTEGSKPFEKVSRQSVHISRRPNPLLRCNSWFGCNRECSGFEAASKIIDHIPFRRGLVFGIIQHYKERFAHIKADRTCEILRAIGAFNDVFYIIDHKGFKHAWTPVQLVNKSSQAISLHLWYASDIEQIEFLGGPPTKMGIYRGTLLDFLLDRVAVMVLLEGIKALDGVISADESYSKYV